MLDQINGTVYFYRTLSVGLGSQTQNHRIYRTRKADARQDTIQSIGYFVVFSSMILMERNVREICDQKDI